MVMASRSPKRAPGGGIPEQEQKKIAAAAGVDVRTVVRALSEGGTGTRIRSLVVRLAIVRALREYGYKREALTLENGQ